MGLYSVFIEDWLQVFARENFRFVRLEDYAANKTHVLLETIRFLGLGQFIVSAACFQLGYYLSFNVRMYYSMYFRGKFCDV